MIPQAATAERPLEERLAAYGCTGVIRLDSRLNAAAQLDYLDLLPKQSNHKPVLSAVAEHQGVALLYLVDSAGDVKSDSEALATVRRQLANRSDPAWLGVVRPGSLEIFPIGFGEIADSESVRTIPEQDAAAPLFFQSLVHGTFSENHDLPGTDYVFRKIFELLTHTTNTFVPQDGSGQIDALEVLSMAGRALFFRFLIDRKIVLESECSEICPAANGLKDAFSTAEKAAQTSAWLDATFNGDFLPLVGETIATDDRPSREGAYLRYYKHVGQIVDGMIFTHLQAILLGWRAIGNAIQTEFDWADLDFAHIPVGVLSQVYESFSHRADPLASRDTSVHYTPRTIASLMVDEAFAATKDRAGAKVLDSSCGAGIFLVLAFRRLVRERWIEGERPKTSDIQDILYNQIRGFDISESALRLAALGLYITAIELNASPRPPKELKFPRDLRGEVLHRFGIPETGRTTTFLLGSLGSEVPVEFNKHFDIVLGNPPWTRLRDDKADGEAEQNNQNSATDELNEAFTAIGRRVLTSRGFSKLAKSYKNPDKNPDVPFLWRAMEWAKDGGVIGLAMHPRLFMRTSGKGFQVWQCFLKSLEITGILNGTDLRKTAVWEGMDAAFCVIFARNANPIQDHRFYFSSPTHEPRLNGSGRFRIDYEAARPLRTALVEKQPWVLKTLSLGTWLDVEVMEQLLSQQDKTLGDRWGDWDKNGEKTGKGYDRSPGLRQKFVDFLAKLPIFEPPTAGPRNGHSAPKTYGELFGTNRDGESSAHMPRRKELYQAPLVIIPKAPGDNQSSSKAYLSSRSCAFSQSYYGYSCAGHPEAGTMAALIYLLAHSTLFRYFSLMVSVSQGVDYMLFTKHDFDALPFPEIATMSAATKKTVQSLAKRFQSDKNKPWQEMNAFIFSLYGLDADAVQVAEDTLFASAPYRRAGREALDHTTTDTRFQFIKVLNDALEPYFGVCGDHVAVRKAEFQSDSWNEPWFFVAISRQTVNVSVNSSLLREAMNVANQRGSSRIIVHAPKKQGILLGILDQRRWWTATRARLCAQHIIRERLGAFGLPEIK